MLAAECGRALSPLEQSIYYYYVTLDVVGMKPDLNPKFKPGPHPLAPSVQQVREAHFKWIERKNIEEAELCAMFLEAIQQRDGHKILKIAEAVWFLKDTFGNKPVDPERAVLLSLKQFFESTGERWTIQLIAYSVQESTGNKIEDHKDGFSALRRKCKELGVPIAKSRRGRRKKAG